MLSTDLQHIRSHEPGWFNLFGPVQIDVKMWLYMVGAVLLRVNLATSFLAHVNERTQPGAAFAPPAIELQVGGVSTAAADVSALGSGAVELLSRASLPALCYHACMLWFIYEYMYNERVHLYTYDLFAEVGCWRGCGVGAWERG